MFVGYTIGYIRKFYQFLLKLIFFLIFKIDLGSQRHFSKNTDITHFQCEPLASSWDPCATKIQIEFRLRSVPLLDINFYNLWSNHKAEVKSTVVKKYPIVFFVKISETRLMCTAAVKDILYIMTGSIYLSVENLIWIYRTILFDLWQFRIRPCHYDNILLEHHNFFFKVYAMRNLLRFW